MINANYFDWTLISIVRSASQAIIVGSYAETSDMVFINIQPDTNFVLAKESIARSMLRD